MNHSLSFIVYVTPDFVRQWSYRTCYRSTILFSYLMLVYQGLFMPNWSFMTYHCLCKPDIVWPRSYHINLISVDSYPIFMRLNDGLLIRNIVPQKFSHTRLFSNMVISYWTLVSLTWYYSITVFPYTVLVDHGLLTPNNDGPWSFRTNTGRPLSFWTWYRLNIVVWDVLSVVNGVFI